MILRASALFRDAKKAYPTDPEGMGTHDREKKKYPGVWSRAPLPAKLGSNRG
jgi:hypothetical protein